MVRLPRQAGRVMAKAAREQTTKTYSYIVFVDEAGFMLAPLVRCTWAPRGHTPVIRVASPHERISVIGAMTIRREDRRFGFYFHLLEDNANFRGDSVVRFIENVRRKLHGPITLLWDSIPIHGGRPMNDYLAAHRTIVIEPFPKYAPELNPVHMVWSYIKYGRLSNYCQNDLTQLRTLLTAELSRLQRQPELLEALFSHTRLTLGN
jgi:transposase